jgi:hypothetical protein
MTMQTQNQERRSGREAKAETIPAFKPVALPALAAAMRAAQARPSKPKETALPAILRKDAI